MASTRPHIRDTLLWGVADAPQGIVVGSAGWYRWLETATGFAFTNAVGSFTARKEQRGPKRAYWKAYRRLDGVLHRVYLGKDAELTLERLNSVAAQLAGQPQRAESLSGAVQFPHNHLLSTKLALPLPRAQLVQRPRLIASIQNGVRGKLTLLAAPAGSGKTTLLASWIGEQYTETRYRSRVAWLALDPGDNDPSRFWQYVIAALERVAPGAVAAASDLIRSAQTPAFERLLAALVNGLSGLSDDLVLVLDDYHFITTPAIHQAVALLLDHLPPRLRLLLATRSEPPLPLVQLRARGELTDIRADEVRFTPDEAARFLQEVMQLSLTGEEIATLEVRTEGWIAGLQFAALAMRGRDDLQNIVQTFTGRHRFIVDYLAAEVIDRQPPHLQTFLLQTCILDRMCGPLCDTLLLGRSENQEARTAPASRSSHSSIPDSSSYSQLLLEELDRANLFLIPMDAERRWYRYHHLFADVLRQRLRQGASESELAALHLRASGWYEEAGLLTEAITHALAASAWHNAANLIERAHRSLLSYGIRHDHSLGAWLAALPLAVVVARPKLCLIHAWSLARSDVVAASPWVDRAEQAFNQTAHTVQDRNISGEITALRALVAASQGESDSAIQWAQQALADLDPSNLLVRADVAIALGRASLHNGAIVDAEAAFAEAAALGRSAGNIDMGFVAACNQAYLQRAQGKLRAAIETCQQTLTWAKEHRADQALDSGWVRAALADLLREQNDLDTAMRLINEAIRGSKGIGSANLQLLCLLVLARIQQAQGSTDDALSSVGEMQRLAEQFRVVPLQGIVHALQIQLALQKGDLSAASEWADQDEQAVLPRYSISPILLVYGYEHATVARFQWLLARGRDQQDRSALQQLQSLLEQQLSANGPPIPWLRIKLSVLQALVYQALKNDMQARICLTEALQSAIEYAPRQGYGRVFLDEGKFLHTLLIDLYHEVCKTKTASPALIHYVKYLLDSFPKAEMMSVIATPTRPPPMLPEPLTEREIAVLRLLADGLAQPAIAAQFVVSTNTVKTHIRNIYGKLGAHTRAEAIATARALQLL